MASQLQDRSISPLKPFLLKASRSHSTVGLLEFTYHGLAFFDDYLTRSLRDPRDGLQACDQTDGRE